MAVVAGQARPATRTTAPGWVAGRTVTRSRPVGRGHGRSGAQYRVRDGDVQVVLQVRPRG
jgi:hypothetical protein